MADFFENNSFPFLDYFVAGQSPSDPMNSASHPGTQTRPHRLHGQQNQFLSSASGMNQFITTNNVDPNNFDSNNHLLPRAGTYYLHQLEPMFDTQRESIQPWFDHVVYHTSVRTNYRYVPSQGRFMVTKFTNSAYEGERWRQQLGIHAQGNLGGVEYQAIPPWGNHPVDATTASVDPAFQGVENEQHLAPDTTNFNNRYVHDDAHPLQPPSTAVDVKDQQPPPVSDPLYFSTPQDDSSKTDHIYSWLSAIPAASHNTVDPVTADMTDDEHKPLHGPYTWSKAHDSKPRFERPVRPLLPKEPFLSTAYNSGTPGPRYLPPGARNCRSGDPPKSVPYHAAENMTALQSPERSSITIKNEVKPDDPFKLYTTMYDSDQDTSDDDRVSDFNAPNTTRVSNQDIAQALQPYPAQDSPGRLVTETGLGKDLEFEWIVDQCALSNVSPVATKRRQCKLRRRAGLNSVHEDDSPRRPRRAGLNGGPKVDSSRKRRTHPPCLYFCTKPKCKRSLESGMFGGFKTSDDARRHLLVYEEPQICCTLCRANGIDFRCKRKDNLYQSVFPTVYKLECLEEQH